MSSRWMHAIYLLTDSLVQFEKLLHLRQCVFVFLPLVFLSLFLLGLHIYTASAQIKERLNEMVTLSWRGGRGLGLPGRLVCGRGGQLVFNGRHKFTSEER